MMTKLKKALIIIPCMVFGLFLCQTAKISANEAVLTNGKFTYVGDSSMKENKYYFATKETWEFKVNDYKTVADNDTLLRYRVIRPDGKATDWSDFIRYVDNKGNFTVNSSTLNYTKSVSLSDRNSVVPLSTYYLDIEYYSKVLFFKEKHQEEKDETVKIVVENTEKESYNTPKIEITRNPATNKYTIKSSVGEGDKAYTLITGSIYFFSKQSLELDNYDLFYDEAIKDLSVAGSSDFTPAAKTEFTIDGVDAEYKYLYVLSATGHSNYNIEGYNIVEDEPTDIPEEENKSDLGNEEENTGNKGIMDWSIGELILVVLIVVLFVSCALIITQKIIDYKKRLY